MNRRIILFIIAIVTILSFVGSGSVNVSAVSEVDCNNPEQVAAFQDFANSQEIVFYSPCSTNTCQTSASIVTTLTGADNREKIFNYLKARGLTAEQAAGVTGNIQNESGFSPSRQETSQAFPAGGWGLVQWTFGRRSDPDPAKGVVAYLNSKIPDIMATYYSDVYGGGVTESSGFVPANMPVEVNDKLLLNELDFLYQESNRREIGLSTVSKIESAAAGDNEWQALTKQTTVEKASNLWVYNFERPANVDVTAVERVASGQTILGLYTAGQAATNSCAALNGPVRDKIVAAAEKENAAWVSGIMKPGDSFKQYTYGVNGEWCAWFVSWIYKEAGYPVNDNPQPYYSYVGDLVDLAKKGDKFEWHPKNGLKYVPQPGDIAIYGNEQNFYHTNIVISADGANSITTIGGNEGAEGAGTSPSTRGVKKSEASTYWASEAFGYISPKGN